MTRDSGSNVASSDFSTEAGNPGFLKFFRLLVATNSFFQNKPLKWAPHQTEPARSVPGATDLTQQVAGNVARWAAKLRVS